MPKNKKLVKSFFKKVTGSSTQSFDPERDWKLALLVFFLTAIFLACLNTFFFIKIQSGDFFESTGAEESSFSSINHEALEEVIQFFEQKETELLELKSSREAQEDGVDPGV